jgi:hypothetical protein
MTKSISKKNKGCPKTKHNFVYQYMCGESSSGMSFIEKRILYCTKCGKIKELNI